MTADVQRALDDVAALLRQILHRLVDLERLVDDIDRRMRPYGDGSRSARRSHHGE